ncbi:unnamed protein product, partial [Parnassius apollo]
IDVGNDDSDDDPTFNPEAEGNEDEENDSSDEYKCSEDIGEASTQNYSQSSQNQSPALDFFQPRRLFWKTTNVFEPLPPAPTFEETDRMAINLPPNEYVTKYIPSDFYKLIAFHTSQSYLAETGQNLNTSEKVVMRTFWRNSYDVKTGTSLYSVQDYISYYRISSRTREWTIRLIFHLYDFALAASWIEYKSEQEILGTRKKDILDYLGFRRKR